jgi:hypothetical protein
MVTWLIKNPVTEEIVHGNGDNGKNTATPDEVHKFIHATSFTFDLLDKKSSSLLKHEDEALYARFADDILTPPPNL